MNKTYIQHTAHAGYPEALCKRLCGAAGARATIAKVYQGMWFPTELAMSPS